MQEVDDAWGEMRDVFEGSEEVGVGEGGFDDVGEDVLE